MQQFTEQTAISEKGSEKRDKRKVGKNTESTIEWGSRGEEKKE